MCVDVMLLVAFWPLVIGASGIALVILIGAKYGYIEFKEDKDVDK